MSRRSRLENQRLARKVVGRIRAASEPRHERVVGRVTAVTQDAAGVVEKVTVRVGDGNASITVPALGWTHIAAGAELILERRGPSSPFTIADIRRRGDGTGSADASIALSTPSIEALEAATGLDPIPTESYITPGGAVRVRAYFAVWQIAEQYRQKQIIQYEVEVREANATEANTRVTARAFSPAEGLIMAKGIDNLTDTQADYLTLAAAPSPPGGSFNFPVHYGVVEVESEQIFYRFFSATVPSIQTLTRAYNTTTAAAHSANRYAVARTQTVVADGLRPNVAYEARTRAICVADGRRSSWSSWTAFTTAQDTTAPSWSGATGLAVQSKPYELIVTWSHADANNSDLAHYDVQVSVDGSTWSNDDIFDAGNGTRFVYQSQPGRVRYVRLRAVDTTGNASGWSSAVRGASPAADVDSPTTQRLTNPSFASTLNDWAYTVDFGGTVTRDADTYFTAAGAARLTLSRAAIPGSGEGVSNIMQYSPRVGVAPGDVVRFSCWLYASDLDASDVVSLKLMLYDAGYTWLGSRTVTPTGISTTAGGWTYAKIEVEIPAGVAYAQPELEIQTSATAAGTMTLYVDDCALYVMSSSTYHMTSNFTPSAAASVGYDVGHLLARMQMLPGLVALWPMSASDARGYVMDAAWKSMVLGTQGTVTLTEIDGVPCASFANDAANYLWRASQDDLEISGALTIVALVNPYATAGRQCILDKTNSYTLAVDGGYLRFTVVNSDTSNPTETIQHPTLLESGAWALVAGRFVPGTGMNAFVGTTKATLTTSAAAIQTSAYDLRLGLRAIGDWPANMAIGIVALCKVAVSDDIIGELATIVAAL